MKCAKCNAGLRESDELKWECNVCHQMCKANLTMLAQIQTQRNNGYTGTMVSCPFCGGVLDDGHETIHWDCMYCGTRRTGDIKTFLQPEVMAMPEQAKAPGKSAEEVGLMWEDGEGPEEVKDPRAERRARREREREERAREREEREKKGFFADEEEKNRFLAESSMQTLGEEIPDSLFEDIPLRRKSKPVPETNPSAPEQEAVSAGAAIAGTATPPKPTSAPTGVATTSTSTPPKPTSAPTGAATTSTATPPKPASASTGAATTSTSTPPKPASAPTGAATTSTSTPQKPTSAPTGASTTSTSTPSKPTSAPAGAGASTSTTSASAASATPRRPLGPKTESGPIPPSSTAFASTPPRTAPTGPDSDKALENASFERPRKPKKKQIWPKVIATIVTLLIVAALGIGIYVGVQYFLSPTRQFRSAIQKAEYTTAEEIYNSKIKGNEEDERIAEIAVEHFLSEAFELYKSGAGDGSTYAKLKDFAESILNMNTASYELAVATTPPEELEPSPEPSSEPTADASASPDISASPEASGEPEASAAPEATEEPEATPEATEEPEGSEPVDPADDDISAVLAQAKEYVSQKKYEEAYNYLSSYKKSDTSGQVKKEMASVNKKWKAANIKEFKDLCAKLTIVYAAAEKRYHIVPRGYYTNYNQIARSNNVGGIAYMDQGKKKVSVTKIGKKGALTAYGKTNRAYLMKFKEMIEKYPYLAKEIS